MLEKKDTQFGVHMEPLSQNFVAEIDNINLKEDLTENQFSIIKQAIVKYKVLLFKGQQDLDPEAFRRFSKRFGTLSKNGFTLTRTPVAPNAPFKNEISGRDDMQIFENHAKSAVGRGNVWHSDVSYKKIPPAFTLLQAHILPDFGGDTLFMDMEAALLHLPKDFIELIKNKSALHSGDAFINRLKKQLIPNPLLKDYNNTYHPLITKHPDSGKAVLFYNIDLVKKISDSTTEESEFIIQTLNSSLTKMENIIYRHRWNEGDLLIWDNRALMHYATYDYDKKSRLMYRTTVDAKKPPVSMY